jgi:hypothetical protein
MKATPTKNSSIIWIIGGLLMGASLFVYWPRESSHMKTVQATTSASAASRLTTAENAVRAYHLRSLKLVAAGDPEGERLIALFERVTFYGTIVRPGRLSFDLNEGKTRSVMIIVASQEQRVANGYQSAANWQYINELRVIFTPLVEDYTELWAGVRLTHEISHVAMHMDGTMPDKPTDQQLHNDEIRAHRLETRLVDRWTHGEYLKRIDAWFDAQPSLPDAPRAWFEHPDRELIRSLQPLFPDSKSVHEDATRNGSLLFTMNDRLAKRRNLNDMPLLFGPDPSLKQDLSRIHMPK